MSEKAINRNADMHVLEKSHRAVVPVCHPNKVVQAAAGATAEYQHRSSIRVRAAPAEIGWPGIPQNEVPGTIAANEDIDRIWTKFGHFDVPTNHSEQAERGKISAILHG